MARYSSTPVLRHKNLMPVDPKATEFRDVICGKVKEKYSEAIPSFAKRLTQRFAVDNLVESQCRLCGIKEKLCCKIFESNETLSVLINTYMPIMVSENDFLPLNVCLECLGILQTIDDLAYRCYLVEACLLQHYNDYRDTEIFADKPSQPKDGEPFTPLHLRLPKAKEQYHPAEALSFPARRKGSFIKKYYYNENNQFVSSHNSTDTQTTFPDSSPVAGDKPGSSVSSPEAVKYNLKSNLQKILLGSGNQKIFDSSLNSDVEMTEGENEKTTSKGLVHDHGYSCKKNEINYINLVSEEKVSCSVSGQTNQTSHAVTVNTPETSKTLTNGVANLPSDEVKKKANAALAEMDRGKNVQITTDANQLNLSQILSNSNMNLDEPVFLILVNDEKQNSKEKNIVSQVIQGEDIGDDITEVEILGPEDSNDPDDNQYSESDCQILDEEGTSESANHKEVHYSSDELSSATKIDEQIVNPDEELAKFSEEMKMEQIKRWFTIQILRTADDNDKDKDNGVMMVTYVVYYSKINGRLVPHHFSLVNDSFSEVTRRRAYSIIHTMLKEEKNRVMSQLEKSNPGNSSDVSKSTFVKPPAKKPFRTTCVYCSKTMKESELMKHTMESHMVQCGTCKVYHNTADELINHECEAHGKHFFQCESCQKKFLDEEDLYFCNHTYNCSICKKQFFNWVEFLNHEKIHFNFIALKYVRELKSDFYRQFIHKQPEETKVLNHACSVCGKKFEHQSEVEQCNHTYECKMCRNSFNNYPLFVTHGCITNPDLLRAIGKKRSQKKVIVQCCLCEEQFDGQKMYLAHYFSCAVKQGIPVDPSTEIKSLQTNSPVRCVFCQEAFKSIFIFELHYSTCYRSNAVECKDCEEIIPVANRAEHQEKCSTDVLCDFCGATFPSKRMYRHHLRQQLDGSTICATAQEAKDFSFNGYISESFDTNNCHICGKVFINGHSLDRHIKSVHLGLEKSCPLCGMKFKKFNSITMLLKHRKTHPEEELKEVSTGDTSGSYQCSDCDKWFSSKLLKLIHEIYHHNKVLHKCTACETEFVSLNTLKCHETKCCSKMKDKPSLTCEFCGKTFQKQSLFQQHLDTHDVTYTCDLCEKTFKKLYNLSKHKEVVHFNTPTKCDICDKEFSCEKYLRIHKRNLHSGVQYLCQVCGKTFHNKKRLTLHATVHTGVKPHQCRYCDKKFRTQSIRNIHEDKHKNIFKYECNFCQHKFSRFINLYVHKRKVHADKCTYQCLKCGCGYNDQEFYNTHIQTCTGRKRKNFDVARSSHCTFCDKFFASSRYLKAHYGAPSETGTFVCSNFNCRKKFDTECSLKMHKKVHATSKFPCKLCGEAFLGMKQLELHCQLKHNETFPFHCSHCGRGYHFEKFLEKHVKYCNESLQQQLQNVSTKSKKPIVKCDSCGKIFGKFKDLRVHMTIVHGSETYKDYACRICDSKYDSYLQLSKHSKHHFKDPANPGSFRCPKCKVQCADFDLIMNHVCGENLPSQENGEVITEIQHMNDPINFKIEVDPEDMQIEEVHTKQEAIITVPVSSEGILESQVVSGNYLEGDNVITINSVVDGVVDSSLLKMGNNISDGTISYEVEQMKEGIVEGEEEAETYSSDTELVEQAELADGSNLIYHCSFCSSNFDDIVTLQNHLNVDHGLSLNNLEFQIVEN